MTTSERQIQGDGAQPPSTKATRQRHAATNPQPAAANPWYRRVSFWRAVAGMAVAIALGCAAITLETLSELSARNSNFHHRLELIGSRISRLRSEAAEADRQLATLHAEQLARANVNRVLSAPDVTVLRLAPGAASNARGLVVISRQAGGAIIEVAGLRVAAGYTSVMWWLPAQAPPAKAAELDPGADGRLSLAIQMPPRGARIAGAIVTLETVKSPDKPNGRIMLRGVLTKPQVFS